MGARRSYNSTATGRSFGAWGATISGRKPFPAGPVDAEAGDGCEGWGPHLVNIDQPPAAASDRLKPAKGDGSVSVGP